jgi:hypothetical protein
LKALVGSSHDGDDVIPADGQEADLFHSIEGLLALGLAPMRPKLYIYRALQMSLIHKLELGGKGGRHSSAALTGSRREVCFAGFATR